MKKEGKKSRNNKGQVTIFVIIGIVVVISAVLIYMFFPQISFALGITPGNPQEYISECLSEDLEKAVKNISLQGGETNPENYYLYEDNKISYLCYTNKYYKPCVVQKPMLKKSIENEIMKEIEDKADACFLDMKKSYEKRGYDVSLNKENSEIRLIPEKIVGIFNYSLNLKKGEETSKYENLQISINNNLYELISIATSILSMEVKFGDSETTAYMNYYHDLKVEKKKQSDGTIIYILSERTPLYGENKNLAKFQFASRSYAWPPGY